MDLNHNELQQIGRELTDLRSEMLELESEILSKPLRLHAAHHKSARNLVHYLALRRHDIRQLQTQLASLGLSSLGRTEGHVMSGIGSVLTILNRLGAAGAEIADFAEPVVGFGEDRSVLEQNTEALFGPGAQGRRVRIMVTMSTDAAKDYGLVRDLLAAGMDCMRINCAHDNEEAWEQMIRNLQQARKETGRPCKVLMDVAGPKLRTGPIEPGLAVMKCRPKRDELGRVRAPVQLWLVATRKNELAAQSNDPALGVPTALLKRLRRGDEISFRDARGSRRNLQIVRVENNRCLATMARTAYFVPGLQLTVKPKPDGSRPFRMRLGALPRKEQTLLLKPGDTLIVTRSAASGRPAQYDTRGQLLKPARIGATMPEFFKYAKPGEPIWFDDGKIGGVIRFIDDAEVTVEITQARPEGEKLGAGKGINLPETKLHIPALTAEDIKNLEFIVRHADLVGYSFVRTEKDVRELQARLAALGGESLGVILKVETREAFENLPHLILAAMQTRAVGIMIARGDLAVECGYQRLAEVQEEILWFAEAAHLPVIWATQVLETLAKKGMPSRSEITDAAVGERAECVMLNKGPYAVRAVQILDDILQRMQAHQEKKSAMLRQLRLATAFSAAG